MFSQHDRETRLEQTRPAALRAVIARGGPLLLPAGCVEAHGAHLPLGADTIIAESVATAVARSLGTLVAPPLHYGPTGYAVSGPELGTVDVRPGAFYEHARDVLAGLQALGFAHLVVLVHHQGMDGPAAAALRLAGATLFNDLSTRRGIGWWGRQRTVDWPRVHVLPTVLPAAAPIVGGDHAGMSETALLLHLRPDLVEMAALRENDFWYCWEPARQSQAATAEMGRDLFAAMVAALVAQIPLLIVGEEA